MNLIDTFQAEDHCDLFNPSRKKPRWRNTWQTEEYESDSFGVAGQIQCLPGREWISGSIWQAEVYKISSATYGQATGVTAY